MAADTRAQPAIAARLRPTFALQAVSEVELAYDGATPPLGLLAELTALGWEGATACPPPASAIDWSRPDPVRGTRHTIGSFPATTTAVLHGTEAHREATVAATRTLLASYGIQTEGDRRGHGAAGASTVGFDEVRAAQPATVDATPATAVPSGAPLARVEIVVAGSHADEAARRLADVGQVVDAEPDLWTTTITYRGARQETAHVARRLSVELRVDGVDVAVLLAGLTVWSIR